MLISVLVLLGIFFVLIMLGVPIAFSIALASVSTLLLSMPFDPAMTTMAQRLAGGLDSFTLLAIPFFVGGLPSSTLSPACCLGQFQVLPSRQHPLSERL